MATTLDNLGVLYQRQDKFAEADQHFLRALEIREEVFGAESQEAAASLEAYAKFLRAAKRVAEADAIESRARTIRSNLSKQNKPRLN